MSEEFSFGKGKVSGVLAVIAALLSLGAVICFHFPQWLTTPELRNIYPIPLLRTLLAVFIFISFTFSILSILLSRQKTLGLLGLIFSLLATVFGGANVATPDHVITTHYLGLDWFLLSLLITTLVFVPIERLFCRLKEQKIFRTGWKTDLWHLFFSHLLVQMTSLLILTPALLISKYLALSALQSHVQSQPVILQFLEIILLADFTQYWVHRLFHKVPFLWHFHAIHHSASEMDWLAGSRLHLVDIVVTRGLTLIPLFFFGFSSTALQAYLIFVAFLATFIHTNIRFEFAPIQKIIATPRFHHWHHASDVEAIDKNFAVHVPFLDRLFGTYYLPQAWPAAYGLADSKIPEDYFRQTLYPFLPKKKD